MTRLRSGEGGFALVTAIILMGFMLTSGIVLARLMDAQTQASQQQRTREGALAVDEVALNAQALEVAQQWPGTSTAAFPACSQAVANAKCPTAAQVSAASPTADLAAGGLAWKTQVLDNVDNPGAPASVDLGQAYFSDATHLTAPGYDANKDGAVWVRAETTLNGRTRRAVVLLRRTYQEEQVTRAPVVAGSIEFRNNGKNKKFIDAGVDGTVYVRCTVETAGSLPCLGKPKGQSTAPDAVRQEFASHVQPPRYQEGWTQPTAVTPDALARLKQEAMDAGTYFTSCAQITTLSGPIIWIEGASCSFNGNTAYNAPPAEPGLLVVNGGTLTLTGTMDYYGVIYNPNPAGVSSQLVQMNGNVTVHGGVLVDGSGGVLIGSSGGQLAFDGSAFRVFRTRTDAAIAQGTWRELPAPGASAG